MKLLSTDCFTLSVAPETGISQGHTTTTTTTTAHQCSMFVTTPTTNISICCLVTRAATCRRHHRHFWKTREVGSVWEMLIRVKCSDVIMYYITVQYNFVRNLFSYSVKVGKRCQPEFSRLRCWTSQTNIFYLIYFYYFLSVNVCVCVQDRYYKVWYPSVVFSQRYCVTLVCGQSRTTITIWC